MTRFVSSIFSRFFRLLYPRTCVVCGDVLVDGEFKLELQDLNLVFRGSSNQRIIMVKESLESGNIILWKEPER